MCMTAKMRAVQPTCGAGTDQIRASIHVLDNVPPVVLLRGGQGGGGQVQK